MSTQRKTVPRTGEPFVFKFFRGLAWCAMAAYFVTALTILGLRYVVLPRVDDWRDPIAAVASRLLDAPVNVARIAADWQGLHPRLHFEGLRIDNADGDAVLAVPQARATLAWRSVLLLSPQLLSLELSGLDVTVQRDAQGEVWLAGRNLSTAAARQASAATATPTDPTSTQTLRWLLAQRELVVREATVRWRDAARGDAQDLILRSTHARLRNTLLTSQLSVTTRPPTDLAAALSVQAELRRNNILLAERTDVRAWSGQLYVQLDDAAPRAWLASLPDLSPSPAEAAEALSITAPQGQFATRLWFDLTHGQISNVVADLAARNLDWHDSRASKAKTPPRDQARLQAARLHLRLAGTPHDVLAGLALNANAFSAPTTTDLTATLSAQDLTLSLPGVFDPAVLTLASFVAEASIQHAASSGWIVPVRRLDFANADVAGRLSGVWQSAGKSRAGTLDMQGQLSRLRLDKLHRYLPVVVNPDARIWLASALSGQADGVAVTVRGDLADFPFDKTSQTSSPAPARSPPGQLPPSQFRMAGNFRDTTVDYAPAQPPTESHRAHLGWPRLSQLHGSFDLEGATLRLRAQGGQLHTGPSTRVTLTRASADIPDLNHNATLHVDADSHGAASDYLAMMAHSPLGELLDHQFDQTQGEGNWRVPLQLVVPLLNSEQTQVQGRIEFDHGNLTLMPEVPRLTQLTGALTFNEYGVAADNLHAQFLGGAVRVSGQLARGAPGLQLDGTVAASALQAQWPMPAMQRISGQTDYRAQLIWQAADTLDIHIASALTGLTLTFPPPLQKPAHTPLALTASWGPGRSEPDGKPTPGRWLAVRLGTRADALLEIAPSSEAASYFSRGGVTVGSMAETATSRSLPQSARGLVLNWQGVALDVAAWEAALDEFTLSNQAQPATRPLLPPLTHIDLTSPLLRLPVIALTDATLAIDVTANPPAWHATVQSTEARGDWVWQLPSAIAPGQFTGRFTHLQWGQPEDEAQDANAISEGSADINTTTDTDTNDTETNWLAAEASLDFPNLDVSAQRFTLYGQELGTLSLTGHNVERRRLWRLTNLSITNDDATLQSTGLWRLVDGVGGDTPISEPASEPTDEPTRTTRAATTSTPDATLDATAAATPRGLYLDTQLTVRDLAGLMARLGVPERVAGGTGKATGTLVWRNLPWQRRDTDLSGRASVALDKGVFLRTSSFSARLLELLSLQSLSRLSRLDVRPDAIFRDGFRFDTLRAELKLTGSRIHTADSDVTRDTDSDASDNLGIRVDSPIAAILLTGETDFRSERWNLQAAVVPKLDASGAAIAAGIAVNPLVGVGALIAQWLLKQPLANAMTARYNVTGTWDEPEIKPADGSERTPERQPEAERIAP